MKKRKPLPIQQVFQAQASPLLSLPPELRNNIFELVANHDLSEASPRPEGRTTLGINLATLKPPAITCGRKQLHAEALPIVLRQLKDKVWMVPLYHSHYHDTKRRFVGRFFRSKRLPRLSICPWLLDLPETQDLYNVSGLRFSTTLAANPVYRRNRQVYTTIGPDKQIHTNSVITRMEEHEEVATAQQSLAESLKQSSWYEGDYPSIEDVLDLVIDWQGVHCEDMKVQVKARVARQEWDTLVRAYRVRESGYGDLLNHQNPAVRRNAEYNVAKKMIRKSGVPKPAPKIKRKSGILARELGL